MNNRTKFLELLDGAIIKNMDWNGNPIVLTEDDWLFGFGKLEDLIFINVCFFEKIKLVFSKLEDEEIKVFFKNIIEKSFGWKSIGVMLSTETRRSIGE